MGWSFVKVILPCGHACEGFERWKGMNYIETTVGDTCEVCKISLIDFQLWKTKYQNVLYDIRHYKEEPFDIIFKF
jgi:hypothetical protein